MAVLVGVFVSVAVAVKVGFCEAWVMITSCGAVAPDSRLEKPMAVLLGVINAKL